MLKRSLAVLVVLLALIWPALGAGQNPQVVVQGRGIDAGYFWVVNCLNCGTTPTSGPVNVLLPAYQTTAFGEIFTAEATIPRHLSFGTNSLNPEALVVTTDAGTATADGGKAIVSTTIANGYSFIRSRLAARYIPGQGMASRFTFVSSGCAAGQQQTIGYGDERDGFFFGCCPTCGLDGGPSFAVDRRSAGVDNWVPNASWNGSWGTSAPDITKGRPYQIQFQWLGFGQITYFIEDADGGTFVPAHAIKYAGSSAETSISNPVLPLSFGVRNLTSNAVNTLSTPSMSVIRQGPEPETGLRKAATGNLAAASGTETPVLTVLNNSTFNGKSNRTELHIDGINWAIGNAPANTIVTLTMRYAPALTGATFNPVRSFSSVASYATNGTLGTDAGVTWMNFSTASSLGNFVDLRPYEINIEPGATVTVTASTSAGTPAVSVSLTWVEEY